MTDELILEEFLPYRLAVLSHTVSTTIAKVYEKKFGVSIPEWRVIAILGRFPGLSAVEVADRTMMDKVAVSRAVTKLIKNGRVDREFADADRRRSILNLSEEGRKVHEQWQTLADQYAAERNLRSDFNAKNFTLVADFRDGIPDGWNTDGVGLNQITRCGDFTVSLEGRKDIIELVPGGLFTHVLSRRLNGVLRTPPLRRFDQAHLSFEVCGGGLSAHRTVIDNAFLTERQFYIDSPEMSWLSLPTYPNYPDRKVFLELATKASNPNFPPRMGLEKYLSDEEIRDPKSWLGVTRAFLHDKVMEPKDELTRFRALFSLRPPEDLSQVIARYQQWFRSAVAAWEKNEASYDDVRMINWLMDNYVLSNRYDPDEGRAVDKLLEQYRRVEPQLKVPKTVNGMADLEAGYDYRLNIRGDFDSVGDEVPRGYLEVLTGTNQGFLASGSGRLELANLIASPENPLTARVIVNRVWHWLFGRGIVSTPNNFGNLGHLPTHPRLLDYLTTRFVEEKWSIKRLVRMIVLSETWRQGSQLSEQAVLKDPENRLLHHYPLRRLEAEAVRDAILATSGRLDPQLYGPPIDPFRAKEDPQKRLVSGPLDGDRRRSIYTKISIMEPPPFLTTFNLPQPKIPTGKRDISNTPLQSLTLLNDDFVMGEADHWARTVIIAGHPSVEVRLEQMFLRAFGRPITADEMQRWSNAVKDLGAIQGVVPGRELSSKSLWRAIAHTASSKG